MKEINELVQSVKAAASEDALLLAMGPPDERVSADEDDPNADYDLGYVDPYRPNRTYYFGIKNGVITYLRQVSR